MWSQPRLRDRLATRTCVLQVGLGRLQKPLELRPRLATLGTNASSELGARLLLWLQLSSKRSGLAQQESPKAEIHIEGFCFQGCRIFWTRGL